MDSAAVAATATLASAFVALVLAAITGWYAWETHQYRKIAADSLNQLHAQHAKSYESYVVASNWDGLFRTVVIQNIGPGPAEFIALRAALFRDTEEPDFFKAGYPGLAVGSSAKVRLNDGPSFSHPLDERVPDTIVVEVGARTVLGTEMPTHWYRFASAPPHDPA